MSRKPPKELAGFIFDVDGCVARGSQALPGVPETLAHLRARGIRCAFLTNENMSTRRQVVAKLVAMGILPVLQIPSPTGSGRRMRRKLIPRRALTEFIKAHTGGHS